MYVSFIQKANTVWQWALKLSGSTRNMGLERPQAKRLNTRTFSTKRNEGKTALFARVIIFCKESHFLLAKCHGQSIKQQTYKFGTSDVQAFCSKNKIQDAFFFVGWGGEDSKRIIQHNSFLLLHSTAIYQRKSQLD